MPALPEVLHHELLERKDLDSGSLPELRPQVAPPGRGVAPSCDRRTSEEIMAQRKGAAAARPSVSAERAEVELPDSVELYLNEIARFKLLTHQEKGGGGYSAKARRGPTR